MPLNNAYNPGQMKARITIQKRSLNVSGGVSTETWVDESVLWAEAEEIRGTRSLEMDGYTAVSRARFWVRDTAQSAAISPETQRVAWDGRVWVIQSNVRLTIERGMREIFCEEMKGEA